MSLKIKSVPQLIDLVRNEPVNFTKTPQINGVDIGTGITGRAELDTTHTPVALYNFNGNLEDSSATEADLTKGAGNNRFYPNLLFSGSQSAYFDGSTYYTAPQDSDLEITGDLTILVITNVSADPSGYIHFLSHAGTNDGEEDNFLYGLYLNSNEELYWFTETGSGTNVDYTLTGYPIPLHRWVMIGVTRTSNVLQFWMNGSKLGSSTTLTAPTGGTNGQLYIGAEIPGNQYRFKGHMKSIKIIASALTEAQMMAEFEKVTGDLKFI